VTRRFPIAALAFALALPPVSVVAQTAAPAAADVPKAPAAPNTDTEKALELFKQDKAGEALELLKRSSKLNPAQVLPKVQMAQWFLQANKGQNARVLTEQAITEEPRHPEGYIWNGNIAFNEGRTTDAMLNLSMAMLMSEDRRWDTDQKKRYLKEARYGLLSCYETRGDMAGAKEQLLGLLNDEPKNAVLRQRLASALFRQDSVEEARKELIQAFADDPTTDPPELVMARLWQARANNDTDAKRAADYRDRAEDWFKKAASSHASSAKVFREYALWLLDAGRTDAAVLYVDQATKLDEKGQETQAAKALQLLYKKDFAAAEVLLEAMYKESPSNLFAMGNLCLTLVESGDEAKRKRSIELGQALVGQHSKSPAAYSVYGYVLYKNNRLDEAEKALATASSAGQVSFDTAYYIARLLFDRAKYAEASSVLKGALDAPHGGFVFRTEAKALAVEIAKKAPAEPKKTP